MNALAREHPAHGWSNELADIVRAASGGLLFGVPLLYTVEVTWTGQHTNPMQALSLVCACIGLLAVLNRTSGFRSTTDTTWRDAAMDAIEGVAIAVVVVLAVMVLLGEIDTSTPLEVMLGKIMYEVLPVSIGIGVANNILRERSDSGDGDGDDDGKSGGSSTDPGARRHPASELNSTLADLGANGLGAVFIALSIAPTDEVPMLAATRNPLWLLGIVIASLLAAYAIVFVAGFTGQSRRRSAEGLLQHPVIETVASYVVALLASAVLIALFQRGDAPWRVSLANVIVLAFPAAIGGAAGRLAI